VHTSKGLQWAAVLVPGLAGGDRAQVFPARPRLSTRWTDNPRLLPFSLRGDAADLPDLRDLDAGSVDAFTQRCADRDLAEERRLMYVAATRAAFWLGCSGYWWGDGASQLGPSPFLDEVRLACAAGAGQVVKLWDVSDPARPVPLGALAGPSNTIYSVVFSPDGRTLAAASADDTVRLWNVTDPARARPLGRHSGVVHAGL